jgi:hypothetical protein
MGLRHEAEPVLVRRTEEMGYYSISKCAKSCIATQCALRNLEEAILGNSEDVGRIMFFSRSSVDGDTTHK